MNLLLVLTVFPLGVFLTRASFSMIRQKGRYLLVVDAFLPGKPSLAMLSVPTACRSRGEGRFGLPPSNTVVSVCVRRPFGRHHPGPGKEGFVDPVEAGRGATRQR